MNARVVSIVRQVDAQPANRPVRNAPEERLLSVLNVWTTPISQLGNAYVPVVTIEMQVTIALHAMLLAIAVVIAEYQTAQGVSQTPP